MLEQAAADRMANIPFSGIREIFEECDRLESQRKEVIHLEIGRPNFDTPAPIIRSSLSSEPGDGDTEIAETT